MAATVSNPSAPHFPILVEVHTFDGNATVTHPFNLQWGKLIGRYAYISNPSGTRFPVTYDYTDGAFKSGWTNFCRSCVEETNVRVTLKYHGGSMFSFSHEDQREPIYLGYPYPPPTPNGRCYTHPPGTDASITTFKLTPYSVKNNHQIIPAAFVTSSWFNINCRRALLEVELGRYWICNLYAHPDKPNQARLTTGWHTFCRDLNLRPGDRVRLEVREKRFNRWVAVILRS